jgi:hypothetical protein
MLPDLPSKLCFAGLAIKLTRFWTCHQNCPWLDSQATTSNIKIIWPMTRCWTCQQQGCNSIINSRLLLGSWAAWWPGLFAMSLYSDRSTLVYIYIYIYIDTYTHTHTHTQTHTQTHTRVFTFRGILILSSCMPNSNS